MILNILEIVLTVLYWCISLLIFRLVLCWEEAGARHWLGWHCCIWKHFISYPTHRSPKHCTTSNIWCFSYRYGHKCFNHLLRGSFNGDWKILETGFFFSSISEFLGVVFFLFLGWLLFYISSPGAHVLWSTTSQKYMSEIPTQHTQYKVIFIITIAISIITIHQSSSSWKILTE